MPMLKILHGRDYEDYYRSSIIEKYPPKREVPSSKEKMVYWTNPRTGQRTGGITVTEVGDMLLYKDKNYNEVYCHKSNPAMPILNYKPKPTRH